MKRVSVYDILDGSYKSQKQDVTISIEKDYNATLVETQNAVRNFFEHLEDYETHDASSSESFLEYLRDNGVSAMVDGHGLRVWDQAPNGSVESRFTVKGITFVIVQFDAPGNPPSNQIHYLYLA